MVTIGAALLSLPAGLVIGGLLAIYLAQVPKVSE